MVKKFCQTVSPLRTPPSLRFRPSFGGRVARVEEGRVDPETGGDEDGDGTPSVSRPRGEVTTP